MSETTEIFEPRDEADLRAWLTQHHDRGNGVWLVLRKKSAPVPNLSWGQAVRVLLCFGWIDSTSGSLDEHRSKLWVCPRKKGSWWSGINKGVVGELLEQGLMEPAGLAAVDRAKADGTWSALDEVEAGVIPPDLAQAFVAFPGSAAQFHAFPRSARRALLEWVARAKRPITRSTRVHEVAECAARGERANQWQPRKSQ
ncbi:MAG: YdeI/OmpD-associated family protein [Ornithinimicrobium sp.]